MRHRNMKIWLKYGISFPHNSKTIYSDLLSAGDVPRAALSGRPGARQQITRVLLP